MKDQELEMVTYKCDVMSETENWNNNNGNVDDDGDDVDDDDNELSTNYIWVSGEEILSHTTRAQTHTHHGIFISFNAFHVEQSLLTTREMKLKWANVII